MGVKAILAAGLIAASAFIALPQRAQAGEFCREYTNVFPHNGYMLTGHGTACRQPNGIWRVLLQSGGSLLQPSIRYSYYTRNLHYGGPVYYQPPPVTTYRIIGYRDRHDHRGWNGRDFRRHNDRHHHHDRRDGRRHR